MARKTSLSLTVLLCFVASLGTAPAHASMLGEQGVSPSANRSKAEAIRYDGVFSADLVRALQHSAVPTEFIKAVQELPQQTLKTGHSPSGVYRLVGVRQNHQTRLVAATLHIDGKEQRLFRTMLSGREQWIDDHGRILTAPSLVRPVTGGRMTSPFGWRIHPVLGSWRFHYGVDFALPKGSPVIATDDGVITQIGRHGNYGKLVRLRHPHGIESTYAHLDGFAKGLKVGSHVKRGQIVAFVGQSGLATGPHLYWETVQNDDYIDPLRLLAEPKKLSAHQLSEIRKVAVELEKSAPVSMRAARHSG